MKRVVVRVLAAYSVLINRGFDIIGRDWRHLVYRRVVFWRGVSCYRRGSNNRK
jgi:hypothetical protein